MSNLLYVTCDKIKNMTVYMTKPFLESYQT